MTLIEFSQAMKRRPFRPFTMVLVDGRSFTVDHHEFAAIDRRGRVVTFFAADRSRHEVDTRLIAELVAVDTDDDEPVTTTGQEPSGGA